MFPPFEAPSPSAPSRPTLLAVLTERLSEQPLRALDELSDGEPGFLAMMVSKAVDMLESVCPRLGSALASCDVTGVANEVHKLRSSVSYIGALNIDRLCQVNEPVLREVAAGVQPHRAQAALADAAVILNDAKDLLVWLRGVLEAEKQNQAA